MKVAYKIVGGSGYTTLFDNSAGDANDKFAPSFADDVFKTPGYGAPSQAKVALSNTDGQLPLKWSSNFTSQDAAATAIYTFRSTFKGVPVHLKVTIGTTDLYFPNAVLKSSSFDQSGKELWYITTWETDDVTTTAP